MTCNGNCNGGRGRGRRHRENKGAYQAGWALGILCIILIIIAFAMNGKNGNGQDSRVDPGTQDPSGNGNGRGAAMIFGFFFFIIIIIFLFGSSNVYYRYDDEENYDAPQQDNLTVKSAARLPVQGFGKSPKYVALVFGAKWCGYTKKFVSELELIDQLTESFLDFPVYFKYLECSDPGGALNCPEVRGYPTTYIVDIAKDQVVKEFAGYMPGPEFLKQLTQIVKNGGGGSGSKPLPQNLREHYKKK